MNGIDWVYFNYADQRKVEQAPPEIQDEENSVEKKPKKPIQADYDDFSDSEPVNDPGDDGYSDDA